MQTLIDLIPTYCVALVATVALLARLGAPLPAAPVLLVVGASAGQSGVSVMAAFLASVAGSTIGDAAWFLAGRRYGYATLLLLCKVSMTPDMCVSQNESIFSKWGGSSLMAAKFLPGVSLVAPPMAGALGMKPSRFLLFEVAGGALYSGLFLFVGYLLRAQVQAALGLVSAFGSAAAGVLILTVASCACLRYRRRILAARTKDVSRISVHELLALQATRQPPLLIDVRASVRQALDAASIPGAMSLAIHELRSCGNALARDRQIVLYCSCIGEATSVRGCRVISKTGHQRVKALRGGLSAWIAEGLPVESR